MVVTVEPVESRAQLRRFREIPWLLHHDAPQWSAPVRAYDEWRLDARRHPYFHRGDAAYFMARIDGRPAGRIAAHRHPDRADGAFGFFDTPDDAGVVDALLGRARDWLAAEGCTAMVGPLSWTDDDEAGVLVDGFEEPAVTGLTWHPPWYRAHLVAAGGAVVRDLPRYREQLGPVTDHRARRPGRAERARVEAVGGIPPHAGSYGDGRLVVEGAAAVPDVGAAVSSSSLRDAWTVARKVRAGAFDLAVVVRWDGTPAALTRLRTAAARAGYTALLSPAPSPGVTAAERTHQLLRLDV